MICTVRARMRSARAPRCAGPRPSRYQGNRRRQTPPPAPCCPLVGQFVHTPRYQTCEFSFFSVDTVIVKFTAFLFRDQFSSGNGLRIKGDIDCHHVRTVDHSCIINAYENLSAIQTVLFNVSCPLLSHFEYTLFRGSCSWPSRANTA